MLGTASELTLLGLLNRSHPAGASRQHDFGGHSCRPEFGAYTEGEASCQEGNGTRSGSRVLAFELVLILVWGLLKG